VWSDKFKVDEDDNDGVWRREWLEVDVLLYGPGDGAEGCSYMDLDTKERPRGWVSLEDKSSRSSSLSEIQNQTIHHGHGYSLVEWKYIWNNMTNPQSMKFAFLGERIASGAWDWSRPEHVSSDGFQGGRPSRETIEKKAHSQADADKVPSFVMVFPFFFFPLRLLLSFTGDEGRERLRKEKNINKVSWMKGGVELQDEMWMDPTP
ncbi:hypothetical protein L249_4893, partial [Ophiocordyceps polyrhachis-furcata BCC 54312]